MQMQKPLISVIIPHLNQLDELRFCLESLDQQAIGPELFEVIIADNGSEILPKPDSRNYPVRVVQELAPGPGAARNRGVAEAAGDILAFIDADCRAHPGWLTSALRKVQSSPDKTVFGGDVQIWREDPKAYSALEAYESVFAYRFQLYIEKQGFSGTGNLVVRRQDFYEIGPFKGIQYAEDIEWGRSVRAAGYKLEYAPEMIVYHPARKSLGELYIKWDRHIQHAFNVARGQRHWRLRWLMKAVAILVSPAIDWIKVVRSNRVSGALARLKGIAVLAAVRTHRFARMLSVLYSGSDVVWNRGNVITRGAGR
jgi:GT2 family glycosyltransferase